MQPNRYLQWPALGVVTSIHLGLLALLALGAGKPSQQPAITQPMVMAEMLPMVAPPEPEPPKMQPPESKPQPKQPVPKAQPRREPPKTTTSEKAPTAPKAEQPAMPAPVAAPEPSAPALPAPPAPSAPPTSVTPPRFNAAYLNNPAPVYPPLLRRAGEEGKVVLRVFVTAEGNAGEVQVLRPSSSPLFDEAALNAVRKWRFVPARRGDAPVAEWVQVPINFKLN